MEMYHVLNRGVEKRSIVLDDTDRLRFVHDLYVFNDKHPAPNAILPSRTRSVEDRTHRRDVLVHVHAWCLMPNHYHLLVSPVDDDLQNLSRFMQKLNMGYAKYFNERHDRDGYLWQGKYKKIHIARDAQFLYIPYYIHLNPLDLSFPQWRSGQLQQHKKARRLLSEYRWSSYLDYIGQKNFPSVITKRMLKGTLGTPDTQHAQIRKIVTSPPLAEGSTELEHASTQPEN